MKIKNLIIIIGFLVFGCKQDKAGYEPYKEKSLNLIYNSLFCDNIDLYKSITSSKTDYPWDIIFSDKFRENDLYKVANDSMLETRLRILAFNRLRDNKVKILSKELLGVIIEVGLDDGLDVLAAYKDGSARHIDESGKKMIVWETMDKHSDSLINQLFMNTATVGEKIGPWNKPRLTYPKKGNGRITFLVSDGLYFGEASTDTLFKDPMVVPILKAADVLIQYLMSKTEK